MRRLSIKEKKEEYKAYNTAMKKKKGRLKDREAKRSINT